MSRIRIVNGSITKTSKGATAIEVLDGHFISSAAKQNKWDGGETGNTYHEYKAPEKIEEDPVEKAFSGWWSPDYEGVRNFDTDSRGPMSNLEKTVYFQLNVSSSIPVGTSIKFQLWDYDTGLFFDWINPDDNTFGEKEIIKSGVVREVSGKHRITLKLFLDPLWHNDLRKDVGAFKDGCLDLYWKWIYKNTFWKSDTNLLSVYPSDIKLRIKPAYIGNSYSLPEFYSRKGYTVAFAIDQLPNGEIQKFVSIKIRSTTTFRFEADIQKFKKEIYSETINMQSGKLETASYEVVEINHFFSVKKNVNKVFINEKMVDVPEGTTVGIFKKFEKQIKFGKLAAEIFTFHQVLDEFRNMMPEISSNGKFNAPSISTVVSFIPGFQIAAFSIFIIEWIAQDFLQEAEQAYNDSMWITWQNTKAKGLDEVLYFIKYNSWAKNNNNFRSTLVNPEILNDIFLGKFKDLEEIQDKRFSTALPLTHTIITYGVQDNELGTYYDIVDSVFMNEEI